MAKMSPLKRQLTQLNHQTAAKYGMYEKGVGVGTNSKSTSGIPKAATNTKFSTPTKTGAAATPGVPVVKHAAPKTTNRVQGGGRVNFNEKGRVSRGGIGGDDRKSGGGTYNAFTPQKTGKKANTNPIAGKVTGSVRRQLGL